MNIPILRIPFTDNDIEYINNGIEEILRSGQLTLGKNVIEFEKRFADFAHTKYAIGVNSGTSALEIFLRSIDVSNSSVIVPTNTFMATATSVVHAGGKVIFTDVMQDNLCMDPDDLQEKIRKDTKAVVLVHLGGIITPRLKEIQNICEDNDLYLLEDAAHAHGSSIDGKMAGSLGDGGAFSFYPTKVMTCGEGGILTTDDESIYNKSETLRDHGKPDHRFNQHTEFGYNWRLSEIHAVVALQQMNTVDWILGERRRIAKSYDKKLKNISGISPVKIPSNIKSSYYKYIAYLDDGIEREGMKSRLKEEFGISLTGEVYADPCHAQPVFKNYPGTMVNKPNDKFPVAEYVSKKHICLPLYPGLSEQEINYVVESLGEVL
jgi:dTDP-4-amino-4,6-dideoxygalactose transaminase